MSNYEHIRDSAAEASFDSDGVYTVYEDHNICPGYKMSLEGYALGGHPIEVYTGGWKVDDKLEIRKAVAQARYAQYIEQYENEHEGIKHAVTRDEGPILPFMLVFECGNGITHLRLFPSIGSMLRYIEKGYPGWYEIVQVRDLDQGLPITIGQRWIASYEPVEPGEEDQ